MRSDVDAHFSAGLSEWLPGDSLAAVVDRADHALYEAKAAGRNRTSVAAPSQRLRQPVAG